MQPRSLKYSYGILPFYLCCRGLITPSGVTSVPVGMETPDAIELRKKRIEDAMDQGGDTPALYQVLKEKTTSVGTAMMGSAHVYDMPVGHCAKLFVMLF